MILCVLNPEKIFDINSLYLCPPYLYTVATLPWEIQKKLFFKCSVHTYFRLFTLSQKKTNCYPLTHHTWKMSPHYLVNAQLLSSDWKYVAFLQTLVALRKAGSGLALVALKRTGWAMWQMEYQASNVTINVPFNTFCRDTCFQSFSPLINCVVHHAVLKISPCRNKMLPFSNSSV